jgi:hypothetical protein
MKSTMADELRRELADEVKAMSVDERFELVARLAQEDLAVFQAATGLSHEAALRELAVRRQIGRRPSGVAKSFFDDQGEK